MTQLENETLTKELTILFSKYGFENFIALIENDERDIKTIVYTPNKKTTLAHLWPHVVNMLKIVGASVTRFTTLLNIKKG